jgi:hypothetical protein
LTISPCSIGVVDWKESDHTIAAATPVPKGGRGAAHSLARKATNIGDKVGRATLARLSSSPSLSGTLGDDVGDKASRGDAVDEGDGAIAKAPEVSADKHSEHSVALLCIRHQCGCSVDVKRAPEPSDIIFPRLHTAGVTRCWALLFAAIVISAFCAIVSGLSFFYIFWQVMGCVICFICSLSALSSNNPPRQEDDSSDCVHPHQCARCTFAALP